MLLRIILAVDTPPLRKTLRRLLSGKQLVVETVRMGKHAWERVARMSGDVIIVSESMIPDPLEDSLALMQNLPETRSIVAVTGSEDPERQADLLAAGCDMVLYSGLASESLSDVLETVLEKHNQIASRPGVVRPRLAEPRLSDFVSKSETMRAFIQTVERVIHSDTSLLILGETGVGKERLAQAIHAEGARSDGPFMAINCGALPEALLESEIFGHEEGAFTGATRSRRGAFEMAHNGTIFLDEIGELPLHLQVKLLRVLQEHNIRRVGGEESFGVDVRVMAASNKNLAQEVEEERFRKDLYYRLSVVVLTVPPLRDRREDIQPLTENYLEYLGPRIGRPVAGISSAALDSLARYDWPGNVRELINVIERAMLLCNSKEVTPEDLPEAISGGQSRSNRHVEIPASEKEVPAEWLNRTLQEVRDTIVRNVERNYLAAVLRHTGGRVGCTAERAGIEARTLYEKMKKYDLKKEDFRR